jgi:hypothetical protein
MLSAELSLSKFAWKVLPNLPTKKPANSDLTLVTGLETKVVKLLTLQDRPNELFSGCARKHPPEQLLRLCLIGWLARPLIQLSCCTQDIIRCGWPVDGQFRLSS